MSTPQSPQAGASRPSALLSVIARSLILGAILFLPVALLAGWLDRIAAPQQTPEKAAARPAPGSFETVIAHVKGLPASSDTAALAAEATPEGHWRFVNRAGEIFTVGTPDEMRRVLPVLYPRAKANARSAIYVAAFTAVAHRAAFKTLPAGAELFVVAGNAAYRLQRRVDAGGERFFAEVRANLLTEVTDRRAFDEAAWQLERPLARAKVRVLALEPGGPSTLHAWPRVEPGSGKAIVDAIDPATLPSAMGSVPGQTLVATGRIEGDRLFVQPSSGSERAVSLKALFTAANRADINFIVLQTATTPRQPGGRNWLWQRVDVHGLDAALQHASLADFLNGLGGSGRPFAAVALPLGERTVLDLMATGGPAGTSIRGQAADLLAQVASELTGKVTITGVQANLQSAARVRELRRRLVPGIASEVQLVYIALLFVGLIGIPVSGVWWSRIWPPELRSEYDRAAGYRAAQGIRGLAFVAVFVPLTAPVSAPYNLLAQIRDALLAPVRWWRFLSGRTAAERRQSVVAAVQVRADNAAEPAGAAAPRERERLVLPKLLGRWPNRTKRAGA